MSNQHQRQIHLDFHTSPYIMDVGKDFDAEAFACTMKKSMVNSVTVFAKCHHGMSYYPTRLGIQHPALKGRDLLGEMMKALFAQKIRRNIYTTVAWEENIANTHPEWRQMKKDGTFANIETSADGKTEQPAGWKFLNWLHPDYIEFLKKHIAEILNNYTPEGIFLDIVFFHPKGGWSEECIKFRQKHGLMADGRETQIKFESLALKYFTGVITNFIRSLNKNITIFYNTPNNLYITNEFGAAVKDEFQTHYEIESLPSGFWGYHHFPRLARRLSHNGKAWYGMTGKFQKMWGDFGGLKSQFALEYECFRSQALGGGNIVGDQLHPLGVLDKATYQTIGNVYRQIEESEAFYEDSVSIAEVGVLSPNHPSLNEDETNLSEEGVVMLLEELHYNCDMLSEDADLNKYKLVVLPDSVQVSDQLEEKLGQYLQYGGKVITTGKSGTNKAVFQLGSHLLINEGETPLFPTFWNGTEDSGLTELSNRVIYTAGAQILAPGESIVYIERVLPYFKRNDVTYCSHFHAPNNKKDENYPAVFGDENYICFADAVFYEYRKSGSGFIKDALQWALQKMIGEPLCGAGLPSSILVYPRKKGNKVIVTLLRYLPVRKSIDIDIIDEALTFAGEILSFSQTVKSVKLYPDGAQLKNLGNRQFELPSQKGRLLLEVEI
ncbi:MAG: alpha-amylase family protein [Prolixibacteraceae bacterium]